MTGPQLFAVARGATTNDGCHRCFYCTAPCDRQFLAREYVKDSFTGRDTVAGGDVVCCGCVECLRENATIQLPDAAVRNGQKVRCYSWVVNDHSAIAATKAHRNWLFSVCVYPPPTPFLICLSDSGQKHLLYRSVVNLSRDRITVTLEAERITYAPTDLSDRIVLTKKIAAALGKPAITEAPRPGAQMRLLEYHDDESLWGNHVAWNGLHRDLASRINSKRVRCPDGVHFI